MARADACDRRIPGAGTAQAADSGVRLSGEAGAGCVAWNCGPWAEFADCGARGSLDCGGLAGAGVLFGVAYWKEGEEVSLLQVADDGDGRGSGERKIAPIKRAERTFFQDGERSADYASGSLASEI